MEFSSIDTSNLKIDSWPTPNGLKHFSESVFKASQKCSDGFISISRQFLESSIEILSSSGVEPPCSFAVVGLGSVARGTATPYSDLEYAFVVKSDTHIDYFTKLAVDSYFRIGNMRESPLKTFNIPEVGKSYADNASVGFRIDGISQNAGNIPTGKGDGSKNLILTVRSFTQLYSETLTSPAGDIADLADLLSSIVLIYAHSDGKQLFLESLQNFQKTLTKNVDTDYMIKKRLEVLKQDIESYSFLPMFDSFGPPDNAKLKVKVDIFRYPTLLVDHLRLFIAIHETAPWAVHQQLQNLNFISEQQCLNLNLISALSIFTRTNAYLKIETQHDQLSLYPPIESNVKSIYHLPRDIFVLLAFLFIPLKLSVQNNMCNIDKTSPLNTSATLSILTKNIALVQPRAILKAEIEFFCGDLEQAIQTICLSYGKKVFDLEPQKFGESIRQANEVCFMKFLFSLSTSQKNVLEFSNSTKKYVEMAAYLMYSSKRYQLCLKYFTWLADNLAYSSTDKLKWKVLAADSACQLHSYGEVFSLLGDVLSTLKSKYQLKSGQTLYRFVRDQTRQTKLPTELKQDLEIVAQAFRVISNAYKNVRNFVQAEELANSALTIFDSLHYQKSGQQLGSHYVDLVVSLALIHSERGNHPKAIHYLHHFLEGQIKLHTDQTNHPDIAQLMIGLSQIYENMKNFEAAMDFLTRALNMTKSLYRLDHVDVAHCYKKIAGLQVKMHEFDLALSNYQIVQNYFDSLQINDYVKAGVLVEIGLLYSHKNEHDRALSCLKSAQSCFKPDAETSHIDLASVHTALGEVYNQIDKADLALDHHTTSLEITKKVIRSANSIPVFTQLHGELGSFSIELAAKANMLNIELASRKVNSIHPDLAKCYYRVCIAYRGIALYEQSLQYIDKAFSMYKALNEDAYQVEIADTHNEAGNVYCNMGKYTSGLNHYQKALKMRTAIYGDKSTHYDIFSCYNNMGIAYKNLGKLVKALECQEKCYQMEISRFGEEANEADIASTCNNIGLLCRDMGYYSKSLKFLSKALKIKLAVYGDGVMHAHIANSYSNIASVYQMLGDYGSSLDCNVKCRDMYREVYGEDTRHDHFFISHMHFANVFADKGEYQTALHHYTMAIDMVKSVHGKETAHIYIAYAYHSLGRLYHHTNQVTHAMHYFNAALIQRVNSGNAPISLQTDVVVSFSETMLKLSNYKHSKNLLLLALKRLPSDHSHDTRAGICKLLGHCCLYVRQYRKCWEYLYLALGYYQFLPFSNWKIKSLVQVHFDISILLLHLGHVSQAIEHSELALNLVNHLFTDAENIIPEYTRLQVNLTCMTHALYSALTLYVPL